MGFRSSLIVDTRSVRGRRASYTSAMPDTRWYVGTEGSGRLQCGMTLFHTSQTTESNTAD